MNKTMRMAALMLALVACAGLLSACGSQQDDLAEATPTDMVGTDDNTGNTGSDNSSADQNTDSNNTGSGSTAAGNDSEPAPDEHYVTKVTALNDDGTLALTLCTSTDAEEAELKDYANVDMTKFTPTSAVVNYTLPDDITVYRAADGQLEESRADDIAVGDMLVVYSEKGKSNIVIYPAA